MTTQPCSTPVDTTPPTAPVLTGKATSSTAIHLSWTKSTDNVGILGYMVFGNLDNAANPIKIGATKANVLEWNVTGAKCNTGYNYYVMAVDLAENISPKSNIVNVTTQACSGSGDTQAPTKPTDLTAVVVNNGANTNCLSTQINWKASTDNTGVTGYEIFDAKTNKLITATKETQYLFTNSTENTEYSLYIKAHDAAGNVSEQSNTATVKTGTCPKAPATTTTTPVSVSKLASTGGVLWFNILIALVISGITTYFLLRKPAKE